MVPGESCSDGESDVDGGQDSFASPAQPAPTTGSRAASILSTKALALVVIVFIYLHFFSPAHPYSGHLAESLDIAARIAEQFTSAVAERLITAKEKNHLLPQIHTTDIAPVVETEDVIREREREERLLSYDYALASNGASVACSLTSGCHFWDLDILGVSVTPRNLLNSIVDLDHCWSTASRSAQIGIIIPNPLHPTHVTIDVYPPELISSRPSCQAPRTMVLWGIVDGLQNQQRYEELRSRTPIAAGLPRGPSLRSHYQFAQLAQFDFDLHGASTQTFRLRDDVRQAWVDFAVFVLEMQSGWASELTCLCRVRIHGETMDASGDRR